MKIFKKKFFDREKMQRKGFSFPVFGIRYKTYVKQRPYKSLFFLNALFPITGM